MRTAALKVTRGADREGEAVTTLSYAAVVLNAPSSLQVLPLPPTRHPCGIRPPPPLHQVIHVHNLLDAGLTVQLSSSLGTQVPPPRLWTPAAPLTSRAGGVPDS